MSTDANDCDAQARTDGSAFSSFGGLWQFFSGLMIRLFVFSLWFSGTALLNLGGTKQELICVCCRACQCCSRHLKSFEVYRNQLHV